jgi:hypothetical protein
MGAARPAYRTLFGDLGRDRTRRNDDPAAHAALSQMRCAKRRSPSAMRAGARRSPSSFAPRCQVS